MMPEATEVESGSVDTGAGDDQARNRLDRRNKQLADDNKAEAERQAEREAVEEAAARKAGEWEKIEARYQKQVSKLEQVNQEWETKEQARIEGDARSARERAFLDKIVSLCGTIPKARIQGLMRVAAANGDVVLDPENPTDSDAKKAFAALKSLDPDSFEVRKTAGNTHGSATTQTGGEIEELKQRVEREGWTPELKEAMALALHSQRKR
jgi:hypothetical protein